MAKLTEKEKIKRTKLIEKYLKQGLPPPSEWRECAARHSESATSAASKELGVMSELLRRQIDRGKIPTPDWDLWPGWPPEEEPEPDVPAADHRTLELKVRRLEQEAAVWKGAKKSYQDEILKLQDSRSLFEDVAATFRLPKIKKYISKKTHKGKHTAVIDISDIHYGATVKKEELNGLNEYSIAICKERMSRLCQKVIYLLKEHTNVVLDKLIVLLKGDLISGGMFLHEETGRTDECQPVEQVSGVAEVLAGVLMTWRKELDIPLDVYCVPGNHGRTTKKNEPSQMVANSLDIAACRFTEACFLNDENVTFHIPESGEAVFKIYDWQCLALHGHNMGASGGGGVYGPTYSLVRGGFKTRGNYIRRGININIMWVGHYHNSLKPLSFLYCNGSVIGPDPYSMGKLKAEPEPAQQSLFLIHDEMGIVDWREIKLGVPSEGSIH